MSGLGTTATAGGVAELLERRIQAVSGNLHRRAWLGIQHCAPEVEALHPCEPLGSLVEQHADDGRVVGMTPPSSQHGVDGVQAGPRRDHSSTSRATATTRIANGTSSPARPAGEPLPSQRS